MSDNPSDPTQDEPGPETETEGEAATEATRSAWSGGDEAQRLAELETELAETRDRLLRTAAEMENLRKRTQREKDDAARFAITRFARDIVTISDDLARALESVPEAARSGGDETVATLVTGIEMTERQLQQVFERHGVTRFDPAGQKFDPSVHEAMFEVPDPSVPAGTVAHVVEPGYMIGERVLRPARVGVSAGGPKAATEPSDSPQEEREVASEEPEAGAAHDAPSQTTRPGTDPSRIGLKIDRSA